MLRIASLNVRDAVTAVWCVLMIMMPASRRGARREFAPDELTDQWKHWAALPYTIWIQGERGTGKSRLAGLLHRASGRKGPLVSRSIEAISRGLEVAELLGHCRGAFTSAVADRAGILAQADGGTAFLDEFGRASLEAQSALLHFLDTGAVTPVGGHRTQPVDVRVITATNVDLEAMASRGLFLPDLYDRLGHYKIETLPLRARRDDILPLARCFLEQECRLLRRLVPEIPAGIAALLLRAPWPGNVRDLRNLCQYVAGNSGEQVSMNDLPPVFLKTLGRASVANEEGPRDRAMRVLGEAGGNKSEAARRLRMSRGHLYRVLRAG